MPTSAGRTRFWRVGLCAAFVAAVLLASAYCLTLAAAPPGAQSPTRAFGATGTPTWTPLPTETPPPACGPAWRVVPAPRYGVQSNQLENVAAVAPDDVWAVGYYVSGTQYVTLVEHWDGQAWSIVPSPNIEIPNGIDSISSDNVWVVGRQGIMRWDGSVWTLAPGPGVNGVFNGVSALAANDVWVVGSQAISGGSRTLTAHWDGTGWTVVPSPNSTFRSNYLRAVAAVSPSDVWAVGGTVDFFPMSSLILHWNGTQWSLVNNPQGRYDQLYAVSVRSADDVWAVGVTELTDILPSGRTLVEHWNGAQWSIIPSPDVVQEGDILESVTAGAANDAWAVGYYFTDRSYATRTLVEHWDGTQWSIWPGRNVGSNSNFLHGVAHVSAEDVWAVGEYLVPGNPGRYEPLVDRYSDPCVTPTTTTTPPTATRTRTATPTLIATPTTTTTPCPINFSDVRPADYFYEAARYLYCAGAISGYADGTFRPYNNTTRAQLCKIVVLAEGWVLDTNGPHFCDVPVNHPFYVYVEIAYAHGVISGYADCTFRPYNNVTRGQLCKVIVLAQQWTIDTSRGPHFADVPSSHTFYPFIETAYIHSAVSGYADGTFRPGNSATRGQVCKIVYNAISQP